MNLAKDFKYSILSLLNGPWLIAAPIAVVMLYSLITTKFLQKCLQQMIAKKSAPSPVQQVADVVVASMPLPSAAVTAEAQKLNNIGLEQAKLRVESILASLDEAKQKTAKKVEQNLQIVETTVASASVSSLSEKIGEVTVKKLQTKLALSNPTTSSSSSSSSSVPVPVPVVLHSTSAIEDAGTTALTKQPEERRVAEVVATMKLMDDFRLSYDPLFKEWIARTGYQKSTPVAVAVAAPTATSASVPASKWESAVDNGRDQMIVSVFLAFVVTPFLQGVDFHTLTPILLSFLYQ